MKAKAPAIAAKTTAPAIRLEKKFPNEGDTAKATIIEFPNKGVIFNFLLY
jgi:hypothetical protein